jgi:hypothetical protein
MIELEDVFILLKKKVMNLIQDFITLVIKTILKVSSNI